MNEIRDFELLDTELQKKIIEVNMRAVKAILSEPFDERGPKGPGGIQGATRAKCFTGVKGIVGPKGNIGDPGPRGIPNCPKCGLKNLHWNSETDVTSCLDCGWEDSKSQNETGPQGPRGICGIPNWYIGTGIDGKSFMEAKIFIGSGVLEAQIGDYYLNEVTSNIYLCREGGVATKAKWVYTGTAKKLPKYQACAGAKGAFTGCPTGDLGDMGTAGIGEYNNSNRR